MGTMPFAAGAGIDRNGLTTKSSQSIAFVTVMNLLKRLSQHRLRRGCIFLPPKTAASLLAAAAIVVNGLAIAPEVLLLKDHDQYVKSFVIQQRLAEDMSETEVENMVAFSFTAWSLVVGVNVFALLTAALMLAGVQSGRRSLLLPWLTLNLLAVLVLIVVAISIMLKLADESALVVLVVSAPIVATLLYFWLVVFSAFLLMRPSSPLKSITKPSPEVPSFEASSHVMESQVLLEASTRSTSIDTDTNIRNNVDPPPPYTLATKSGFEEPSSVPDEAARLLEDKLEPQQNDNSINDDNEAKANEVKTEEETSVLHSSSSSPQLIDLRSD